MKVSILNRIVVAVLSAVALVGMSMPTYAQQKPQQEQQPQQEKKQQPKKNKKQPQQAQKQQTKQQKGQPQAQQQQRAQQQQPQVQGKPRQQRAQQQQPQVQSKPRQQRAQQQQPQVNQPSQRAQRVAPAAQRTAWQQHRASNWQGEHRSWQQRGGYNGYRIPDDRYRSYFGPDHWFRIYSYPVVVYGGYPRFQYEGFWFSLVDPWPGDWSDDWYENDEVYIVYSNDGYYLYNRRHPDVGITISVFLN